MIGILKSFRKNTPKKARKKRKLPPGQRLIKYFVFAGAIAFAQIWSSQLGIQADPSSEPEAPIEAPFQATNELTQLSDELVKLNKSKTSVAGFYAIDLDSGDYVDVNANKSFSAASIIKVPVLVSLMAACERGEASLDDMLELKKELVTEGSGYLQWRKLGSKISARNAAQLMITISDNTATNMLIEYLGGKSKLNREFKSWGLKETRIMNYLVDKEGTNVTSPFDLCFLMARVDKGDILNDESKTFMYDLMGHCKNRSMLPSGIGLIDSQAEIIHKTGTIGIMVGDAGIIKTPSGKRLAMAVQVQRRYNDSSASYLIRRMVALSYNQFENDSLAIPQSAFLPKIHVSRHHRRHHVARGVSRGKHKISHKYLAHKGKKKRRRFA